MTFLMVWGVAIATYLIASVVMLWHSMYAGNMAYFIFQLVAGGVWTLVAPFIILGLLLYTGDVEFITLFGFNLLIVGFGNLMITDLLRHQMTGKV